MKRIPTQAGNAGDKEKNPRAITPPSNGYPSWKIGRFDIEGKWGLESLIGPIVFHYSDSVLSKVLEINDDELNNALTEFDNKVFNSSSSFWKQLSKRTKIPYQVIEVLSAELVRDNFPRLIFPHLKGFETMTWEDILQAKHGKQGKSSNHNVAVASLLKEARDRLEELKLTDIDYLFSLRIKGTTRIYGIRNFDVLDIIWVDNNHEIYPVDKD